MSFQGPKTPKQYNYHRSRRELSDKAKCSGNFLIENYKLIYCSCRKDRAIVHVRLVGLKQYNHTDTDMESFDHTDTDSTTEKRN